MIEDKLDEHEVYFREIYHEDYIIERNRPIPLIVWINIIKRLKENRHYQYKKELLTLYDFIYSNIYIKYPDYFSELLISISYQEDGKRLLTRMDNLCELRRYRMSYVYSPKVLEVFNIYEPYDMNYKYI